MEDDFVWLAHPKSMNANVASKLDVVCITNGYALVTVATDKPSVCFLIYESSNGNDMIVTMAIIN